MWLRLLILMSFPLILLVGSAFAQSDIQGGGEGEPSPTYPPNLIVPAFSLTPTATLSPRALEGIYQKLRVNYGLELDSSNFPDPNPGARDLLEIFAQHFLGSSLHMPYAEYVFSGTMGYDGFDHMLRTASSDLGTLVSTYLTETESLPMVSVGLREDGFALLYSRRCAGQWCNTPQEYMNFLHQNGALAIYGLYVKGYIGDEDAATILIQQAFPSMKPFILVNQLVAVEDNSHSRYKAIMTGNTSISSRIFPIAFHFGTRNIQRYTLIYAVVGIGESFVDLVEAMPDD
jgi:hypothetical protein